MDVKLGAAINVDLTLEQDHGRCQGQAGGSSTPVADNPFRRENPFRKSHPQRQRANGFG